MIPAPSGVPETDPLLPVAVNFTDEAIDIDHEALLTRASTRPHARVSVWSSTRSSWRTWPKVNARRNVPSVDGAGSQPPRSRRVPGAQHLTVIDAIGAEHHPVDQRHHLAPGVRRARTTAAKTHEPADQTLDPQPPGSVAISAIPASETTRSSSKTTRTPSSRPARHRHHQGDPSGRRDSEKAQEVKEAEEKRGTKAEVQPRSILGVPGHTHRVQEAEPSEGSPPGGGGEEDWSGVAQQRPGRSGFGGAEPDDDGCEAAGRGGRCARVDSNHHGENSPQGPQPCASTNSATGAGRRVYPRSIRARRASGQRPVASVHGRRYSANTCSLQAIVHWNRG